MRSNWHTFVGPVQRCMIILLSNASKPIVLSAGNIYNLDIEQFRTVNVIQFSNLEYLNSIYVYFMIIPGDVNSIFLLYTAQKPSRENAMNDLLVE